MLSTIVNLNGLNPQGINDAGQIAGGAEYRREANGKLTFLGSEAAAIGINAVGDVAGYNDFGTTAFLFKGNTPMNLGVLPGSSLSEAVAVNSSDEMVGFASESGGNHAFLYDAGNWTDLYAAGGSKDTLYFAMGINNSGQVVGLGDFPDGAHDFLYENGMVTELCGLIPASSNGVSLDNRGLAINDNGQIVGEGVDPKTGAVHAFLYSLGLYTDLGALPGQTTSNANAINDLGQVVGTSYKSKLILNNDSHAFIYSDGQMIDLNTLLPANSGWVLQNAVGINDKDQIIGWGTFNGVPNQTFLLNLNTSQSAIVPTALTWDSTQGGVDVSYNVTGAAILQPTAVTLYWASGDQFEDVIGDPIADSSQDIAVGTLIGSYGPFNVPGSVLGQPPQGAQFLLAVADPTNVLGHFDPAKNIFALGRKFNVELSAKDISIANPLFTTTAHLDEFTSTFTVQPPPASDQGAIWAATSTTDTNDGVSTKGRFIEIYPDAASVEALLYINANVGVTLFQQSPSFAPADDRTAANFGADTTWVNVHHTSDKVLQWYSPGFTVYILTTVGLSIPISSTGPLEEWVDIDNTIAPQGAATPFDVVVNNAEQLIEATDQVVVFQKQILDKLGWLAFSDPGQTSLLVTDPSGNQTGVTSAGTTVGTIPGSAYSDAPLAVIIAPRAGEYQTAVHGLTSGTYDLNAALIIGTEIVDLQAFTGTLTLGQSVAYFSTVDAMVTSVVTTSTPPINATVSGLVYNRATQLFGSTITLTNTGSTILTGTLQVELTGLPAGVTLANASGIAPDGNPYITVSLPGNVLVPGASIMVGIHFSDPSRLSFSYGILIKNENVD